MSYYIEYNRRNRVLAHPKDHIDLLYRSKNTVDRRQIVPTLRWSRENESIEQLANHLTRPGTRRGEYERKLYYMRTKKQLLKPRDVPIYNETETRDFVR